MSEVMCLNKLAIFCGNQYNVHMKQEQKAILYIWANIWLIFRRNVHAHAHAHHALQLTFPLMTQNLQLDEDGIVTNHFGLLIHSDVSHLIRGQKDWVGTLYINPETAVAHTLKSIYKDSSIHSIDRDICNNISNLLREAQDKELECAKIYGRIQTCLQQLLGDQMPSINIDPRIQEAIQLIEQSEGHKISAADLANSIYLSESRMGHLFKTEIGIPLRRYLLWQRLTAAMQNITEGYTFTDAAHQAGFSDLAHLTRTAKQMFGFAPSTLFANLDDTAVQFCDDSSTIQ